MIQLKRVYDAPAPGDGLRVLVDRFWPRGLSKEKACIDLWLRELAPSTELRKWFGHDPERWEEFRSRYTRELEDREERLQELEKKASSGPITLVYAAKYESHNNAVALRMYLEQRRDR